MPQPAKTLSFNNRWLETLVQATPDETDCLPIGEQFVFPDTVTPVTLLWEVNGDEFLQVFSSVMYGADLAYPDCAINVMQIFLRSVCANVDLCTEIADCITNNATTQFALNNAVQNGQYGFNGSSPEKLPASQTGANLLPSSYTCDNDHLCGMARWIVNNLHDGAMQLLQQIEAATNLWEALALFVDNVEVVSWFGSALELAAWLQDQLAEYYDLAWSTTVEDELTCDIYCAIQPLCEVTIDGLIEAYESAVLESFSLPALLSEANDLFNWIDTLDYSTATSKAIVGSFHYAVLQLLSFGSNALKFTAGIRSFSQMIATGADETDTYCALNCNCPTNWCVNFDFIASNQSFIPRPDAPYGIYVASTGWQCTFDNAGGVNDNRTLPYRDFGVSFTANNWQMSYKATNGGIGRSNGIQGYLGGFLVFQHDFGNYIIDGASHADEYSGTHTCDAVNPYAVCQIFGGLDQDAITLEAFRISGVTGSPPIPSNC